MAYYNWGEQIGNSFMNMYAQNQQKRLEEARMGMEKERLGMDRQKMESQLRTDALQQQAYEREARINAEEDAAYNAAGSQWYDLNGNKVNDQGEMISSRFDDKFRPMSYAEQNLQKFVNGKLVDSPLYARRSDWDYNSDQNKSYNASALGVWQQQQENANAAASRGIAAQGNMLEQRRLDAQDKFVAQQNFGTAVSNDQSYLNTIGYYSQGKLKPYTSATVLPNGQKYSGKDTTMLLNDYLKETNAQFPSLGSDYTNNALGINFNRAASNATPASGGSKTTYTLNKNSSSGVKLPSGSLKISSRKAAKAPNLKVDPSGWAYVEQNGHKVWVVDDNNNLVKGSAMKAGGK